LAELGYHNRASQIKLKSGGRGPPDFNMGGVMIDALAKSLKIVFSVIPAEAGIQQAQAGSNHLDSGLRRSDDVLRCHPG
jgi:hypothetical protein